jgi:hypothetical protein
MFRAILCSSSGGQNCIFTACGIALNRCTVRQLAESDDTRCCNNTIFTSWRWSKYCSKHVELFNVIHILQNKGIVHQFGNSNVVSCVSIHFLLLVREIAVRRIATSNNTKVFPLVYLFAITSLSVCTTLFHNSLTSWCVCVCLCVCVCVCNACLSMSSVLHNNNTSCVCFVGHDENMLGLLLNCTLSYSWYLRCVTQKDVLPPCFQFSHYILPAQQNTAWHVETKIASEWRSAF